MHKIDSRPVNSSLSAIPSDVLQLILSQVPPKQWPQLKSLSRAFYRAIKAVERVNPLHNSVDYDERFYQQDSAYLMRNVRPTVYPTFTFKSKRPLVSIRQLGSTVNHQWAPLITCDWQSRLRLYYLFPRSGKAVQVCTYTFHALAASGFKNPPLTAAISLGNNVVSADGNGFIAVWLPQTIPSFTALRIKKPKPTTIRLYHEHTTEVTTVDCINTTQFVTGDRLGTLKYWDLEQEKSTATLELKEAIKDLRVLPQQKLLVLTSDSHQYSKLTIYHGDTSTILIHCENYTNISLSGGHLPYDMMKILTPTVFIGCNLLFQSEPEQNLSILDCSDRTKPKPMTLTGPLRPVWGVTCNFFSRSNQYCYAHEVTNKGHMYISNVTEFKKNGYRYAVVFCRTASELRPLLPEVKILLDNPPEQNHFSGSSL